MPNRRFNVTITFYFHNGYLCKEKFTLTNPYSSVLNNQSPPTEESRIYHTTTSEVAKASGEKLKAVKNIKGIFEVTEDGYIAAYDMSLIFRWRVEVSEIDEGQPIDPPPLN